MKQTVLTFISTVDPQKQTKLEATLGEIRLDLYHNKYLPFPSLDLLHFASFFVIEQTGSPALLVFENNFDGSLNNYLDQLVSIAGAGLHQIYGYCTDYPSGAFNTQTLKQYLTAKVMLPNAYHIGNVGRPARDIKDNRQLRESLQAFLDQSSTDKNFMQLPVDQVRTKILDYAKSGIQPQLYAALPPHQTFLERALPWFNLILTGLLVLVVAVIFFIPVIIALIVLRKKEKTDYVDETLPSVNEIERFISTENQITQNHLANVTMVKPGWFRLNLLKAVLFAANLAARCSNKGKLSGIPSIHFAHWSIINKGKILLFLSNFDGSWTSYLDDFIDKAATGLTGVWTNTYGFPRTRFLVLDGARDEVRFKNYARNHQVPSLVWYSAYPDLTVQNIDKDSRIREQMTKQLSEVDTQKWLQLF